MAADLEANESVSDAEAPAAKPGFSLAATGHALLTAIGHGLPRIGLHLFLLLMPAVLASYPAYLLIDRLADYAVAPTLEAALTRFTINDVRDPDRSASLFGSSRYYDIQFTFEANGKRYAATQQKSWPAPGLRRNLEAIYAPGDLHTLHFLNGGTIRMEEDVARDAILRQTGLAGLLLLACLCYYLLKMRLAPRWPALQGKPSPAMVKSVLLGQTLALVLAVTLAALIQLIPLLIPTWLYLGAYGSLALLLCLSLRLLVFEDPPPPPPVTNESPRRAAKI